MSGSVPGSYVEMSRVSPTCGDSTATIHQIGDVQLALGGGHLTAGVIVQQAGASDAIVQLFDGTSTAGTPLLSASGAIEAALPVGGCFAEGLFCEISSSSTLIAPTVKISFTGEPAA